MHTITIARVEEGQELAHGCADRDGWAWRCTCQGGPHGSLMVYGDHDGAEDGAALHLAAVGIRIATHHQLDDAADEFRRGAQGIRDGLTLLSAIVREFEELEEPRTNELETIRIMAEHVASMANDVWSALETFD